MQTTVNLADIEMDTGIQCRASIDTATVDEYAERMGESVAFPPVDLFGTNGRLWIGDGWHRIFSAKKIGALTIEAIVHQGGRSEALRHALGANAAHGHRRTNADKRRCVEIAARELKGLSARAIAELCGVSHVFVAGQLETVTTSTRTGSDGKQYPAKKGKKAMDEKKPRKQPHAVRVQQITELLAEGFNREQIADAIGWTPRGVRDFITKNKIAATARRGKGTEVISARRVVEETANAMSAAAHGLRLLPDGKLDLPADVAAEILAELKWSMRALTRLISMLKECANV